MRRIALDLGSAPVLDRDQDAAGIGAIVRARGMDNFLHALGLYLHGRGVPVEEKRERMINEGADYFISKTSFSFALLISSIFLISSSVSF